MSKKKKVGKPTIKKVVTKEIKCALSSEELLKRGDEMAKAQAQLDVYEREKREYLRGMRESVAAVGAIIERCKSSILDGFEMRNTQCCVLMDYELETVIVMRDDTGEIDESRPMTNDELSQLPMEGEDGAEGDVEGA